MTDMRGLEGWDEVERNLAVAVAAMEGAAREESERLIAKDMAESARGHAAVLTGALRNSIRAQGGEVEATDEAAPYNEFGTSHMAAQPFMRPAMNEQTKSGPTTIVDTYRRRVPFLD